MNKITQEKFLKLRAEIELLFQQISSLKNQQFETAYIALSIYQTTESDRREHNCRIGRARSC